MCRPVLLTTSKQPDSPGRRRDQHHHDHRRHRPTRFCRRRRRRHGRTIAIPDRPGHGTGRHSIRGRHLQLPDSCHPWAFPLNEGFGIGSSDTHRCGNASAGSSSLQGRHVWFLFSAQPQFRDAPMPRHAFHTADCTARLVAREAQRNRFGKAGSERVVKPARPPCRTTSPLRAAPIL